MKQFLMTVLGAFVGVWGALMFFAIVSVLMGVVFLTAFSGAFSSAPTTLTSQDKSILYLNLNGTVSERSNPDDAITSFFNDEDVPSSLDNIVKSISLAKADDNIKGIFIECNGASAGMATAYEIRKALEDFKLSKKWIYAYGNEGIEQRDYYVASVADSMFINPYGMLDIRGLATNNLFYKNMLDKLGIEMQVIRVGSFKSAVEPYMLTSISDANRLQQEVFLGSIWSTISNQMSKSRNIATPAFNVYADSITLTRPTSYLKTNKLIDATCYKFDFDKKLKKLVKIDDDDDLIFVTPEEMVQTEIQTSESDKIAVLYAVGEINSHSKEGIVADDMIENILDVAKDDDIKGLVLRVNSPGGSAYDSEQIWAALEEFKKSGKPYAVSMGDYAASGGYYISCGANRIFAEPVTITGSIGIFGVIPCIEGLLENKIGINQSLVQTNANGDLLNISKKMTPFQQQSMQNYVNAGYELFASRCAQGRKMPIDKLKEIAQGRVWDGANAMKIGLIDEFGGLNDAIKWVANKAKVKKYSTTILPEQEDFVTKYLSKYVVTKIKSAIMSESGDLYKYQEELQKILKQDHIQARMDMITVY
ncbi:MAG: signal peptide peptidase SppA [Muribaculaceae bacterium]